MFVIARLAALGLLFLAAGWGLELLSICPLVKRIWTPSFVLFSGGWCLLTLSLFCWIIDLKQVRGWAFPLIVIGMNSIAIYCMSWTMTKFAETAIQTHLGSGFTQIFGEAYESLVIGVTITAIFWLTMFWMYRHRVFLKI